MRKRNLDTDRMTAVAGLQSGERATRDPCVAVLVLNYCSYDDTVACVGCVRDSDYPNIRLIVLDNASPDGSGAALARAIPANEFVAIERNLGYAGGNNVGIEIAMREGADYILILNPDARLPPHAISRYVAVMSQSPQIGALNPVQLEADQVRIDAKFRNVLRAAGWTRETLDADFPPLLETTSLFGACLLLSRRAIERVGGFDPLYFAYGEEIDLCRRIRFHAFRLVVTPEAPVVHLRTAEKKGGMSPFVAYLRLRAMYLVDLKAPTGSFTLGIKQAVAELGAAVLGKPPVSYPYNECAIPRRQSLRVLLWLIGHLPQIWLHRYRDRQGPRYVRIEAARP